MRFFFFLNNRKSRRAIVALLLTGFVFAVSDCKKKTVEEETGTEAAPDPLMNRGIGPVTSVVLGALESGLALKGKNLFEVKCSACHKLEARHVGPALAGVTGRRSPEWIMNMMLNPEEMVQKDPIASELFAQFMTPMANQSLTQDEARAILEFLRQSDGTK